MSAMLLALLVMAQAPPAATPGAEPPVKVKKQKPQEVCETVQVTGSRVPQRVCRPVANQGSVPDLNQGFSDAFFGVSKDNTLGKVGKPPL